MYKIKLTEIASEYIRSVDKKSQQQIIEKIEALQEEPLKIGKQLKGNLKDYRSIRSIGQKYRIIYQVNTNEIIVLIVAVGIRKEGDKKDIYELMKKYIKIGILKEEKS